MDNSYTVSYRHVDGIISYPQAFETLRAANVWIKYLLKDPYTAEVFLHRGGKLLRYGVPIDCGLFFDDMHA